MARPNRSGLKRSDWWFPISVDARADVQLATSEIATNAVRHGRLRQDIDALRISAGTGRDAVRVTVEQPTVASVRIEEPRLGEDAGGFGLHVVDIADDWGHDPGPPGRVWFEFSKQL